MVNINDIKAIKFFVIIGIGMAGVSAGKTIGDSCNNKNHTLNALRGNIPSPKPELKSGMAVFTAKKNGYWDDPATWGETTLIPAPADEIHSSSYTITVNANGECGNIVIENGGAIKISGADTLNIYGNWTNNGTFNAGTNGTVRFAGANPTSVYGTSTTVFKHFILGKAPGSTLHVNKNTELSGTLTFTSGTMQVNPGASVSCTGNTGFTVKEYSGIFINGGNFSTGPFSVEIDGPFQIDGGTASLGSNPGNSATIRNNGIFTIKAGTVNIAGRLKVSGGEVNISGGSINLNTVGHSSSSTATLDLSVSSDFNMAGGEINFLKPNGSGHFDVFIRNTSGLKNFSSGSLIFGDGSISTYRIACELDFPPIAATPNVNFGLRRYVGSTGIYSFPLTDGYGNTIPAKVSLNSGAISTGGYIEATTTNTKHPNNTSSSNFLSRYWTVTLNGIANPGYDISAEYPVANIIGSEPKIAAGAWTGNLPWSKYGAADTGSNTVSATGITATNADFTGITLDAPTVIVNNGKTSEEICPGSSLTLTATATGDPNFSYYWSPSAGLSSRYIAAPEASPASTTTYTVTATDGNGFTASGHVEVAVNPLPTVDNPGNITICHGGDAPEIIFAGQDASSFLWTNDNTSIGLAPSGTDMIPAFTASNTGNATITANISVTPRQNTGGIICDGTAVIFTITVLPTPTVDNVDDQVVIKGGTFTPEGFTTTVPGTWFEWSYTGDNIDLAPTSGTGNLPSFTATNTGVSTFTVTPVYSHNGASCPGQPETFTITVKTNTKDPTVEGITICYNEVASLTATSPANVMFKWYNAKTKGNLLYTGNPYISPPLTKDTVFYVSSYSISDNYESERIPVAVTVQNIINPGEIGGAQTVSPNGDPLPLTSIAPASGGRGDIYYRWQYSINGTDFVDFTPPETGPTYNPPAGITQTTWYRRVAVYELNGIACVSMYATEPVIIDIKKPNSPPIAGDDHYNVTCFTLQGNLLDNDTEPEGDTINITTLPVTAPGHGELVISGDGSFTYLPDEGYIGIDNFIYAICDNGIPSLCDTATVTINVLLDADCDGISDTEDIDDDNDGILDVVEGNWDDNDGDGIFNSLDIDSDNDGIPDNIEGQGEYNYRIPKGMDYDLDGLDNAYDTDNGGYRFTPVDTDSDGKPDYLDLDTDGDGVPDHIEGHDINADGTADAMWLYTDSDNDGLDDAYDILDKLQETSSPNNATGSNAPLQDFDGDGKRDWRDTDDDGDELLTINEDRDNNGDYCNDDIDMDGNPDYLDAEADCELFVPEGFSPNGDGVHDFFQIFCIQRYPDAKLTILNRHGNKLFEKERYGNMKHWGSDADAWWWGNSEFKRSSGNDRLAVGYYIYILELGNGDAKTGIVMIAY